MLPVGPYVKVILQHAFQVNLTNYKPNQRNLVWTWVLVHYSPKEVHIDFVQFSRWTRVMSRLSNGRGSNTQKTPFELLSRPFDKIRVVFMCMTFGEECMECRFLLRISIYPKVILGISISCTCINQNGLVVSAKNIAIYTHIVPYCTKVIKIVMGWIYMYTLV